MLKLYNPSGQRIGAIEHYQNLCVEEEISQLNVISFEVPKSESDLIDFEGYVETEKDGRYVIKEKTSNNDTMEFKGIYDLEELSGFIESKAYVSLSLSDMMEDILVGTGWDFQTSDTSIKTASGVTIDRLDLIYAIVRDTFGLEIKFDNQAKVITAEHHLGSDKGVYLHDEVNLVELKVDGDTYDFATRIIPRGADGLSIESVNGGLPYLENLQYSSKIITTYWSDERYTVPERLMAAAQDKLDILSKPLKSYSAQVVDLSRVSKMTILEYSPGDVITLQDRESGIKEKQRIVLRKKYLDEPERDSVTIANRLRQIDDSVKTEFDGMKQDFSVIRASLQLLDQKVLARVTKNEYDTDKEAMDLAYAELGLSIEGLEAEVLDIDGNISDLNLRATGLENRVANAEGDILALETTAQGLTVDVQNLDGDVANLKLGAEELKFEISNMSVGGRNIFLTSGDFKSPITNWLDNGGGIELVNSDRYGKTIQTIVGTGIQGIWYKLDNNVEYTFSALIKSNQSFSGSGSVPLHYHAGLNNTNQGKIQIIKSSVEYAPSDVGKYKLLYITFKLTQDADTFKPFIYWGTGERVFNIAYLKLEKGNMPTDFVPAPEDVDAKVTTVSTTVDGMKIDVQKYKDGKLTGQTYDFNGSAFTIGGGGGDVAKHTNSESMYTHSDGSYTRIGTSGMERVISGNPKKYHYLTTAGAISASFYSPSYIDRGYLTMQTITLPADFKNKDFQVLPSLGGFTCYELYQGEEMKTPYYALTMSDISVTINKAAGTCSISARLHFARTVSSYPDNPYRVDFKINYMAVG